MGIFDWVRSSIRPGASLLDELAELTGRNQALAERLSRHGAMCEYPNIRAGIEKIAEQEAAHAKALNTILRERDVWSRPPEAAGREGANNWERLSGDLEILVELQNMLRRHALEWEAIDAELSDRIAAVVRDDGRVVEELRALALKCDPQALN